MNLFSIHVPHIGFDRFIPLDWATCALRVRAGQKTPETLEALIGERERSEASRRKTRSILKGLWLAPRADLAPFADRGAEFLGEVDASAVPALCWGMAISAYPFFGKVAELTRRNRRSSRSSNGKRFACCSNLPTTARSSEPLWARGPIIVGPQNVAVLTGARDRLYLLLFGARI